MGNLGRWRRLTQSLSTADGSGRSGFSQTLLGSLRLLPSTPTTSSLSERPLSGDCAISRIPCPALPPPNLRFPEADCFPNTHRGSNPPELPRMPSAPPSLLCWAPVPHRCPSSSPQGRSWWCYPKRDLKMWVHQPETAGPRQIALAFVLSGEGMVQEVVRVISAQPEGTWGWDGAGSLQEEKDGPDYELVMTVTCDQSHDCKSNTWVCGLLPALVGKNAQKWPISVRLPLSFPFLSQGHQVEEEHGGSAPVEPLPPTGVLPTVPCKSTSDLITPLLPASHYSPWVCNSELRSHWLRAVLVTVACQYRSSPMAKRISSTF